MLVENKGKRIWQHNEFDEKKQTKRIFNLLPGAHLEVPDEVAKLWLKTGEVIEYADPAKVKAQQAKLENENEKLKEELAKLKSEAPKSKSKKK